MKQNQDSKGQIKDRKKQNKVQKSQNKAQKSEKQEPPTDIEAQLEAARERFKTVQWKWKWRRKDEKDDE